MLLLNQLAILIIVGLIAHVTLVLGILKQLNDLLSREILRDV
jgi:hypothetical protein